MTGSELIAKLQELAPEEQKLPVQVLGYGEPYFVRVGEEFTYILCQSLVRDWLHALTVNPVAARAQMGDLFNRTNLI